MIAKIINEAHKNKRIIGNNKHNRIADYSELLALVLCSNKFSDGPKELLFSVVTTAKEDYFKEFKDDVFNWVAVELNSFAIADAGSNKFNTYKFICSKICKNRSEVISNL